MSNPDTTGPDTPARAGRLDVVPVPNLLFRLYQAHATGTLRVEDNLRNHTVDLVNGLPASATLGGDAVEPLGRILLELGKIRDEEYQASLVKLAETRRLHGEILREMGAISARDLEYGLQVQLRRKLNKLFYLDHGSFHFEPKDVVVQWVSPLNPLPVIFHGVRSAYDEERLSRVLLPLVGLQMRILPTFDPTNEALALTDVERSFLGRMRDYHSLPDLTDGSVLPDLEARVLLASLLLIEALELRDAVSAWRDSIPKRASRAEEGPAPEAPAIQAALLAAARLQASGYSTQFPSAKELYWGRPLGRVVKKTLTEEKAEEPLPAAEAHPTPVQPEAPPKPRKEKHGKAKAAEAAAPERREKPKRQEPAPQKAESKAKAQAPRQTAKPETPAAKPAAAAPEPHPAAAKAEGPARAEPPRPEPPRTEARPEPSHPERRPAKEPLRPPTVDDLESLLATKEKQLEGSNFFDLLEVDREATLQQIKLAYFRLAKQFHPDRFLSSDVRPLRRRAETVFERISEAYDALRTEERRQRYLSLLTDERVRGDRRRAQMVTQADAQFKLAEDLITQGEYSRAEEYIRRAIDLFPDDADYHAALGWVTYHLAKDSKAQALPHAMKHLLRALVLKADCERAHLYLGRIYEAAGQRDDALRHYGRLHEIRPQHLEAGAALTRLRAGTGDSGR